MNEAHTNVRSYLARSFAIALIYAWVARWVLVNFSADHVVSLVWPSSGLALASLILFGLRYWPSIFVGATLGGITSGAPLVICLSIGVGNTLEAVVGGWLVKRLRANVEKVDGYLFLLLAGALASLVSATVGTTTLVLAGRSTAAVFSTLRDWWMGDVLGITLITPLILVWRRPPLDWLSRRRLLEIFVCFGGAAIAGQNIFLEGFRTTLGTGPKGFVIFAFMTWAAARFGRHGALLLALLAALQGLAGAWLGLGLLGSADLHRFWVFIMVLSVSGIALAVITEERIRAEQSLRNANEFSRLIVESANEGLVVYSPDARITRWNRFLERLTGLKERDVLGKSIESAFPIFAEHGISDLFTRALHGEESVSPVIAFDVRDSRRTAWVRSSYAPMRDASGKVLGVISMVSDLSGQMRAEATLRESEERLRSILDNAPTIIYFKDQEGRYLFGNRRFQRLFDISEIALRGKTDHDLFPTEEAEVLRLNDQTVIEREEAIEFEEWIPLPDGPHAYLSQKFPLRDAAAEVIGVCGISTDITERTIVEEMLRESEQRASLLTRVTPCGVFLTDAEGRCNFVNESWCRITGSTPNEALGDGWTAFLKPVDRASIVEWWTASAREGGGAQIECRVMRADGTLRWALTGALAFYGADGGISGFVGSVIDITDRKLAEQNLLRKILDASLDAMLVLDANLEVQAMNAKANTLFGEERRRIDSMFSGGPEEILPWAIAGEESDRDPESLRRQLQAVRSDGTTIPVEVHLSRVMMDSQSFTIVTVHDITERKRVEREQQLAAMVYRAIGEAILVADLKNRIVAINPAFTALTGYTEEDVIGVSTKKLNSGLHDRAFFQKMWESLERTGHWQGEIWNRRKDGEACLEWLSITNIYGEDGKIERRVAMYSPVTDQKRAEQTIWQQANFDSLTQLPNRRMFRDSLAREIKVARRSRRLFALLFIDLDHFKEINDTLGHVLGDVLLQEAARRLRTCVRESDTVARLGGDEFTIILSGLESGERLGQVPEKILRVLAEPFDLGGQSAYVSGSIGITIYPNDASDLEQLLINADQAMYAAKQEGRNRYSYFTASMQEAAQTKLRLTNDLRSAVSEEQFRVYYQPIVELATGRIHKAEALLRWVHPIRGIVKPAAFIALAEETGLIVDIGDWMFRESTSQLRKWRDEVDDSFQLSVNESPIQFRAQAADRWSSHLASLGLPGDSVVVEITEGLLLETSGVTAEQLLRLRDAGIQIAIDDFGTGYSSLSYLKKFHIDFLKIDQSFVRNLGVDASDLALCEAIIVMAHKLGLKVIAEGVETMEQRDLLAAAGCDFAQGYLYAKPLPASEFEQRLRQTMPRKVRERTVASAER